jgi:hypothetical protein
MLVVAVTLGVAACLPASDVPIPPGYEAVVESARSSVLSNYEALFRPSLAVTRFRCYANGGVVVLFRQVGGPAPGEPAFAMGGGGGPTPELSSWSGGYGDMDEIEEEIEFSYGDVPEVICPPRGPE